MKVFLLCLVGLLVVLGGCSVFSAASDVNKPGEQPSNPQTEKASTMGSRVALLAIPAIAGGAVMFLMGMTKLGIAAAGGGATALAVGLAISRYAAWIEFGGLMLVVGMCGLMLYSATKKSSVLRAALGEVVAGVQRVKDTFWPDGMATRAAANQILAGAQSVSTQAIVDAIKVTK